jgi:hypothetical protein
VIYIAWFSWVSFSLPYWILVAECLRVTLVGLVPSCVHTLVCLWVPVVSSSGFSCVSLGADLCFLLGVCAVSFTPVHCFMKRSTVLEICHCHLTVNIFRCQY